MRKKMRKMRDDSVCLVKQTVVDSTRLSDMTGSSIFVKRIRNIL